MCCLRKKLSRAKGLVPIRSGIICRTIAATGAPHIVSPQPSVPAVGADAHHRAGLAGLGLEGTGEGVDEWQVDDPHVDVGDLHIFSSVRGG